MISSNSNIRAITSVGGTYKVNYNSRLRERFTKPAYLQIVAESISTILFLWLSSIWTAIKRLDWQLVSWHWNKNGQLLSANLPWREFVSERLFFSRKYIKIVQLCLIRITFTLGKQCKRLKKCWWFPVLHFFITFIYIWISLFHCNVCCHVFLS